MNKIFPIKLIKLVYVYKLGMNTKSKKWFRWSYNTNKEKFIGIDGKAFICDIYDKGKCVVVNVRCLLCHKEIDEFGHTYDYNVLGHKGYPVCDECWIEYLERGREKPWEKKK